MYINDAVMAVRHRWRLAVAIGGALLALVAVWTALQPRIYRASASVLIDTTQEDPAADERITRPSAEIGTQEDLLTSALVAQAAVAELGLDRDEAGRFDPALARSRAAQLRAKTDVSASKGSNVLILAVEDRDPDQAARYANAIVSAYLKKVPELRAIAAKGSAQWLEERTADVRRRLEQAQERLAAYQRARGSIGAARIDTDAESLRTLSTELARAESETASARSRANSGAVPEVVNSSLVQQLRGSVAAQAARVAELARTKGPRNPELIAAQDNLATLRSQLSAATSAAAGSLDAASAAASRRESELRARVAQREQALISGSEDQGRLAVLQRDVEAAQQTYDLVRRGLGEQFLRSQASQSNAGLLDRANPPTFPSQPNVPLLLVLGLILGAVGGIGAVIVLEYLQPRVRTRSGVEVLTGRPVLAELG